MSRHSCQEDDIQADQPHEEPEMSVQINRDPTSFIGKVLTSDERKI